MTPAQRAVVADARAALAAAAGVLLLGAPAGLLWARLAPRPRTGFGGDGRPGLLEVETREFIDVDLVFLVVLLALGAVAGGVGWFCLRRHGPAVPVGLALGGIGAGAAAREVGRRVVVDGPLDRYCTANTEDGFCELFDGRFALASPQFVLALAVAAVVTYGLLVVIRERPALSSG